MSEELDGIEVFVAVADEKGFRAAGERLRVSGSAVSQTLHRAGSATSLAAPSASTCPLPRRTS